MIVAGSNFSDNFLLQQKRAVSHNAVVKMKLLNFQRAIRHYYDSTLSREISGAI